MHGNCMGEMTIRGISSNTSNPQISRGSNFPAYIGRKGKVTDFLIYHLLLCNTPELLGSIDFWLHFNQIPACSQPTYFLSFYHVIHGRIRLNECRCWVKLFFSCFGGNSKNTYSLSHTLTFLAQKSEEKRNVVIVD